MKLIPLVVAGLVLPTGSAFAASPLAQPMPSQPPGSSVPTANSPADFAAQAGSSNLFEIASSRLALKRAQNADIKTFAQKMIDDHTKAGADMAAAASAEAITPPAVMAVDEQKDLNQLITLSGVEFESTYVADQTKAHIDAVGLFKTYSTSGTPGPLKDFAVKTLPVLEMHYQMVQGLPKQ